MNEYSSFITVILNRSKLTEFEKIISIFSKSSFYMGGIGVKI